MMNEVGIRVQDAPLRRGRQFSIALRNIWEYIWLVPGLAMMIALFILPLGMMVRDSFIDPHPGLGNYTKLVSDPLYLHVIWNSVVSAVGATFCCIAIGYPTAYAIFKAPPRWRQFTLAALLFSFAVGTVPRTFSWLVVLGDRGLINRILLPFRTSGLPVLMLYNEVGVLVGMVHVMLPFIVLILLGTMMRVGPHLVPAARTLGATPVRAFFSIFLPLTKAGVIAGTMLIFIYSLGFYLVPAVLGGAGQTTVVMQIQSLVLNIGDWGLGAALSTIVAVVSVLGAAVYVQMTGLSDISSRD